MVKTEPETWQVLCASSQLHNGGQGWRFVWHGQPAFAVRHQNQVYAYVNRCRHIPIELDWNEGIFFDAEGVNLMCATHGALYETASGVCVAGPCRGQRLQPIALIEKAEVVYYQAQILPVL
ncbi:MAG: Rieske (2Fe-2S) protein [Neisseriaceae bacterium]|nr:Rieske (2Fe-2S) protein [Neisseriaceae bacterium]